MRYKYIITCHQHKQRLHAACCLAKSTGRDRIHPRCVARLLACCLGLSPHLSAASNARCTRGKRGNATGAGALHLRPAPAASPLHTEVAALLVITAAGIRRRSRSNQLSFLPAPKELLLSALRLRTDHSPLGGEEYAGIPPRSIYIFELRGAPLDALCTP